jgi:hypothetical protein
MNIELPQRNIKPKTNGNGNVFGTSKKKIDGGIKI